MPAWHESDSNLYHAVGAHATLSHLLPSATDVVLITTPTCPWCTRLQESGKLRRLRTFLTARGVDLRHLDLPADDTLRWTLRVAGHTRVPAVISRCSHGSIPKTSDIYYAMSATDLCNNINL